MTMQNGGALRCSLFAIGALVYGATFPDSAVPLPPGWQGPVFRLSQNYPTQPISDNYPWQQFDPVNQPNDYMMAVLRYCLEGNVETDWTVQNNPVRKWYHAPWLHWGTHGREPIHGLTFERTSQPGELAPTQTQRLQNWAVGMYNAPGGFTIGKIWSNPAAPDLNAAQFPPNTVSVKLLFTEGTPAQVPYLAGSKTWDGYIFSNLNNTGADAPRTVTALRLLQVDVAVRDARVNATTGWVFGTFIYDGRTAGNSPYANLKPVGLMWGNDPSLGPAQYQQGARPQQTRLNQQVQPIMQHYGWLGRLNGPVDNPKSSCLSCHSTAQWPVSSPMTPPAGTPEGSPAWMAWFRNILAGQPFSPGSKSLDYSLQLGVGAQNVAAWTNACAANPNAPVVPRCAQTAAEKLRVGKAPIRLGYPITRQ